MEENKKGLTSLEKKWVLYDVANSAFILMVSTLIQIFFHDIAVAAGVSEPNTVAYWNYAGTACTIAVVFLGPVFGTLADRRRMKKPFCFHCSGWCALYTAAWRFNELDLLHYYFCNSKSLVSGEPCRI